MMIVKGAGSYVASFERLEKNGWRDSPSWVRSIRKEGIAHFAERGFPTLQDEDWRFTNVEPIAQLPFKPLHQPSSQEPTLEEIKPFVFSGLKGNRLVFINGHYSERLSSLDSSLGDVQMGSLAAAIKENSKWVEPHLARYARCAGHTFASLNTAFFSDGAFILIPPGRMIEEPIHLLFISCSSEPGATTHPRNLVVAQKNCGATIIETYVSAQRSAFTNALTELAVGEGASIEHCKFQDEDTRSFHVATIQARLERNSNFTAHSISAGARLARNNINITLDGKGIECVLNGLYVVGGDQHVDHHMVVDHAQPQGNSHEYYNGILNGRSRGVFHGRILVRRDAQKTDAKQTNKNLLLSDEATIDTKPQLEIYADDVKCTHGATVGQLNEEAIFYLRSRGIASDMARQMLIHAFAGEILNRIRNEPFREQLDKLLWSRLESAHPGLPH